MSCGTFANQVTSYHFTYIKETFIGVLFSVFFFFRKTKNRYKALALKTPSLNGEFSKIQKTLPVCYPSYPNNEHSFIGAFYTNPNN